MKEILIVEKNKDLVLVAKSGKYNLERLHNQLFLSHIEYGIKEILMVTEDMDIALQKFGELISK